ncbi:hypothetical protein [Demequina sp.]|uniref:hypothetical protein n=1 Tax=Demequina sp. TaxID=2050685 RepID=UPI0025C363BF|nr:hypothetical protein [Demequina sp.]
MSESNEVTPAARATFPWWGIVGAIAAGLGLLGLLMGGPNWKSFTWMGIGGAFVLGALIVKSLKDPR